MKFLFGCEHKKSSIIPQRLYSCWDFFFLLPLNRWRGEQRAAFIRRWLLLRPSSAGWFSWSPPSCTRHKPPSLFHLSVAGVLLLPPPPLLLLLLYCCHPCSCRSLLVGSRAADWRPPRAPRVHTAATSAASWWKYVACSSKNKAWIYSVTVELRDGDHQVAIYIL